MHERQQYSITTATRRAEETSKIMDGGLETSSVEKLRYDHLSDYYISKPPIIKMILNVHASL